MFQLEQAHPQELHKAGVYPNGAKRSKIGCVAYHATNSFNMRLHILLYMHSINGKDTGNIPGDPSDGQSRRRVSVAKKGSHPHDSFF